MLFAFSHYELQVLCCGWLLQICNNSIGGFADYLQDSLVVIQQSSWASLPPELLRNEFTMLEEDDTNWPSRKDIVRNPGFCGKLTLPVSLKQVRVIQYASTLVS